MKIWAPDPIGQSRVLTPITEWLLNGENSHTSAHRADADFRDIKKQGAGAIMGPYS